MPLFISNIIILLNIIFIGTVVFKERRNPVNTIAWVLTLTFIPVFGFILYLLIGRGLLNKKIFRLEKEELKKLNENTKMQLEELQNLESLNYNYKTLMHLNLLTNSSICTNDNEVKIFNHGNEKFEELFKDINNAKEYIHMIYFIINNDELGNKLIDLLTKKAKEGVDVKIVYDALGSFFTSEKLFKRLKNAGAKVYKFSPLKSTTSFRANYRNHRKLVIIDSNIGYLGGINVGDEYLGKEEKLSPWRDTHLKIRGSAVTLMELRFLLDYRHASKEELKDALKYLKINEKKYGDTKMQIVSSGPDEINDNIKLSYIRMINLAKNYLYIQTPYFIPDESFMEALKICIYSGVDLRIMVPKKPDKEYVYLGSLSYLKDLILIGATVYLYDGFIHSKTILMDDEVLTIGSANMDIRSFKINFEVNAFMYDENLSKSYKESFYEDVKKSTILDISYYENMNYFNRIKQSVFRLISPLF
ncbi:cardiolipin synthase [Peptostreptococcaceae bacterium AGR-M142]